ncbi:TetR/AcrR family transcriptional regulator [Marinobacter zhejiangensis]|uniref:Transcriptional regulator, TetR family n=1 Tax=Marinobacter zhejiangensis TaxID=488535 RepID=A0A1I4QUT5_9GAMM|nr:TetR/AcrR family transcriptional regulator [Marinobacter zhejiangensis]SFM43535.1 transcriptional regulator, TetR family [Marinobacter zhejiangensis]
MNELSILERRFPGRRAGLKREILEQALACFNETGIEATTIDSIRARCEASVGAIYHHFGNKEGILGALFFTVLDDQHEFFEHYLDKARSLEAFVSALVISYVDWVVQNPEWARFQFQARASVAKGPHRHALAERNARQLKGLKEKLGAVDTSGVKISAPFELLPSLIIGASENYCRAWLSGRVQTSPSDFREQLAAAAWRSLQG